MWPFISVIVHFLVTPRQYLNVDTETAWHGLCDTNKNTQRHSLSLSNSSQGSVCKLSCMIFVIIQDILRLVINRRRYKIIHRELKLSLNTPQKPTHMTAFILNLANRWNCTDSLWTLLLYETEGDGKVRGTNKPIKSFISTFTQTKSKYAHFWNMNNISKIKINSYGYKRGKVNMKFILKQASKDQRESISLALLFLYPRR